MSKTTQSVYKFPGNKNKVISEDKKTEAVPKQNVCENAVEWPVERTVSSYSAVFYKQPPSTTSNIEFAQSKNPLEHRVAEAFRIINTQSCAGYSVMTTAKDWKDNPSSYLYWIHLSDLVLRMKILNFPIVYYTRDERNDNKSLAFEKMDAVTDMGKLYRSAGTNHHEITIQMGVILEQLRVMGYSSNNYKWAVIKLNDAVKITYHFACVTFEFETRMVLVLHPSTVLNAIRRSPMHYHYVLIATTELIRMRTNNYMNILHELLERYMKFAILPRRPNNTNIDLPPLTQDIMEGSLVVIEKQKAILITNPSDAANCIVMPIDDSGYLLMAVEKSRIQVVPYSKSYYKTNSFDVYDILWLSFH